MSASAVPPATRPAPPRRLLATRYVTALREGGSVPAVVEADDGALYVVKFRAAAQGGRVLAAELIVGELARAAGLRVPELALIDIDAALGRSEPHQEIQELLIASAGTNLAMGYLAGAVGYDVAARRPIDGALASAIVALDVFAANVDRTARNPNLLWWRGELWLIDHGAALYWHHGWDGAQSPDELAVAAARPFTRAAEHVLLPFADALPAAGAALAARWATTSSIARSRRSPTRGWKDRAATSCARRTAPGCARGARRCPPSSTRRTVSEPLAFDYMIVQVVPRVERDERLNAGVILFCPAAAYLGCRIALDERRLRALAPDVDIAAVRAQLDADPGGVRGRRRRGPDRAAVAVGALPLAVHAAQHHRAAVGAARRPLRRAGGGARSPVRGVRCDARLRSGRRRQGWDAGAASPAGAAGAAGGSTNRSSARLSRAGHLALCDRHAARPVRSARVTRCAPETPHAIM